jgi:hypothetical protein
MTWPPAEPAHVPVGPTLRLGPSDTSGFWLHARHADRCPDCVPLFAWPAKPVERQRPLSLNGGKGNGQDHTRTHHHKGKSTGPSSWKNREQDQADDYGGQRNLNHPKRHSQIHGLQLTKCNSRIGIGGQTGTALVQAIGSLIDLILDLALALDTVLVSLQIVDHIIPLTVQIARRTQEVLVSRVLARPQVSQLGIGSRDRPHIAIGGINGHAFRLVGVGRVTCGPHNTNFIGIFTTSRTPQDFTRGRNGLQCNIIEFTRHAHDVSSLKSWDRLPVSVDVDHGLQVCGDTLRTTRTRRGQLHRLLIGQQYSRQGIPTGGSRERAVRSCQGMLSARQGHAIGRRCSPVSVLARLRARKVSAIGLGPQEVLGGHNSTRSIGGRDLGPFPLSFHGGRLQVAILQENLRTCGVTCYIHLPPVFGKVPRRKLPVHTRILGDLYGILLVLDTPEIPRRGRRNAVQFPRHIIPLSDLCELCGKQIVEATGERLLQLHYCCLGKLIRVRELRTENTEDRKNHARVPIGFLRTPTQLGQRVQKGRTCGHDTAKACKFRGIRNLTLAVLSRNRNLKERHRGHFVLEPEDNGRAHSGIPRSSTCVACQVGGGCT